MTQAWWDNVQETLTIAAGVLDSSLFHHRMKWIHVSAVNHLLGFVDKWDLYSKSCISIIGCWFSWPRFFLGPLFVAKALDPGSDRGTCCYGMTSGLVRAAGVKSQDGRLRSASCCPPSVLCAVCFLIVGMVPTQLSTNTVNRDDCLCPLAWVHSWSAAVDAEFAV